MAIRCHLGQLSKALGRYQVERLVLEATGWYEWAFA